MERSETGTGTYEIASEEGLGVMRVAETVYETARKERGIKADVELVENPQRGETMIERRGYFGC